MIRYLFYSMAPMLFEPLAVAALIGMIAALISGPKKRSPFFWFGLFFIGFMCGWRLVCHSIMISSRYSAILVFPAVLLSAYACFQMEPFARRILRVREDGQTPKRGLFCRILPYLCIAGLLTGCFIQLLHINPYAGYIRQACKVCMEDAGKENAPVSIYVPLCHEATRVRYYCRSLNCQVILDGRAPHVDVFRQWIRERKRVPGKHYFFSSFRRDQHFDPAVWQKAPAELLFRSFTSRRCRSTFYLFRMTVPQGTPVRQRSR